MILRTQRGSGLSVRGFLFMNCRQYRFDRFLLFLKVFCVEVEKGLAHGSLRERLMRIVGTILLEPCDKGIFIRNFLLGLEMIGQPEQGAFFQFFQEDILLPFTGEQTIIEEMLVQFGVLYN